MWDEAEAVFAKALRFGQKRLGPAHPDTAKILAAYANLLRAAGKEERAKAVIADAKRLAAKARAARRQSAAQGTIN
jgi:hypothetical protein